MFDEIMLQYFYVGGTMAASWAILKCMGQDGYLDMAKKLMAVTDHIKNEIQSNIKVMITVGYFKIKDTLHLTSPICGKTGHVQVTSEMPFVTPYIYTLSKHSYKIIRDGQVCFSTWLFLGHAKH